METATLAWQHRTAIPSFIGSNLFLQLYRKTGGVFELAPPADPLYPSEYRIPYLNAPGQNQVLKGTIDVTIFYFLYNDELTPCIMISGSRTAGGNESNTATTCVFVLGDTGTCGDGIDQTLKPIIRDIIHLFVITFPFIEEIPYPLFLLSH